MENLEEKVFNINYMNRITDYKKLAEDITAWIKQYAQSNNIKSLVVGVSGGIDSAVVSTLCAMTGLPTYCCSLPIQTTDEHLQIATAHILWLRDRYPDTVADIYKNLSDVHEQFMSVFGFGSNHTIANTKSRLRMTMLYAIACNNTGIVVGTGNKIEDFGIGFATKGGDLQCDISPIADLYKTEVRELGRYLGVSQEILDAAPTDGLWMDNRTDEQQIGATYDELEWTMEELTHYNDPRNDVYYTPDQTRVMERYKQLNKQNQHKMLPIPMYKLPV